MFLHPETSCCLSLPELEECSWMQNLVLISALVSDVFGLSLEKPRVFALQGTDVFVSSLRILVALVVCISVSVGWGFFSLTPY